MPPFEREIQQLFFDGNGACIRVDIFYQLRGELLGSGLACRAR